MNHTNISNLWKDVFNNLPLNTFLAYRELGDKSFTILCNDNNPYAKKIDYGKFCDLIILPLLSDISK
jgi:hypothetical protein